MKIFKCDICGEIFVGDEASLCCGQLTNELTVNNEEFSFEKHIPVVDVVDDMMVVRVGEVLHPMSDEHFIEWIMLVNGSDFDKKKLSSDDAPVANFNYVPGSVVYAYCNLHGLWKFDVK